MQVIHIISYISDRRQIHDLILKANVEIWYYFCYNKSFNVFDDNVLKFVMSLLLCLKTNPIRHDAIASEEYALFIRKFYSIIPMETTSDGLPDPLLPTNRYN